MLTVYRDLGNRVLKIEKETGRKYKAQEHKNTRKQQGC